jgi:hypothetical protein
MMNQFLWQNKVLLKKLYNPYSLIILFAISIYFCYLFHNYSEEKKITIDYISPTYVYSGLLIFPLLFSFFYDILIIERIREIENFLLERKFNYYRSSISKLIGFKCFNPVFAFQGDFYKGVYKNHFVVISINSLKNSISIDWYESHVKDLEEESLIDYRLKSKVIDFKLETTIQETLEIGPYE